MVRAAVAAAVAARRAARLPSEVRRSRARPNGDEIVTSLAKRQRVARAERQGQGTVSCTPEPWNVWAASSASVHFECRKPHVNYGEAMKLRIPSLVPYECLVKACKATLFLYNLNFHIKGSSSTK